MTLTGHPRRHLPGWGFEKREKIETPLDYLINGFGCIWSKPNYALAFGFNKWSSSYLEDISLSHAMPSFSTQSKPCSWAISAAKEWVVSAHYYMPWRVPPLSRYCHVLPNYNCVLKHKCQMWREKGVLETTGNTMGDVMGDYSTNLF